MPFRDGHSQGEQPAVALYPLDTPYAYGEAIRLIVVLTEGEVAGPVAAGIRCRWAGTSKATSTTSESSWVGLLAVRGRGSRAVQNS
jgi:hypothetical protein